jgi:hypothetical protein
VPLDILYNTYVGKWCKLEINNQEYKLFPHGEQILVHNFLYETRFAQTNTEYVTLEINAEIFYRLFYYQILIKTETD